MFYRYVAILALLLVSAGTTHAQAQGTNSITDQCLHVHKNALARDRNGSTLNWITNSCGSGSDYVTHTLNGVSTTILLLPDMVKSISFIDLNSDGHLEIEADHSCGVVNCDTTIYSIDSHTLKTRAVMHYVGLTPKRSGKFFSVPSTESSTEGKYSYYEILSYAKLRVASLPAFTLTVDSDLAPDGHAITGKYKCIISPHITHTNWMLVREAIEKDCPPGSPVTFKASGKGDGGN